MQRQLSNLTMWQMELCLDTMPQQIAKDLDNLLGAIFTSVGNMSAAEGITLIATLAESIDDFKKTIE